MMKQAIAAAAIVLVGVAPLRADLKYTVHSELKPAPAPAADAAPPNPMIAMVGPMIAQQILPNGPADTTYTVNDHAVRVDYEKGGMNGQQEGTVMLVRVNGEVIQLTPKDKTFWKSTTDAFANMLQTAGIQPEVTVKPGDETATIAGVRAKRSTVEVSIPLPIPAEMRAQLPPGFPAAIGMTGEAWFVTSPYEKYLAMSIKAGQVLGGLGFAKVAQNGIVVRQVMRGEIFGGQQLETVVTKIGEVDVPASVFDVPSDFKEVPSPIK